MGVVEGREGRKDGDEVQTNGREWAEEWLSLKGGGKKTLICVKCVILYVVVTGCAGGGGNGGDGVEIG
ncbi:hypothetical protein E2C01_083553 [Portunus trituberculatus]|uniref:Uncharacterized protein n=1 Tax=Portunus trituberculatus TaxID=210409 RepID=A0A5B7J574_PORTR|nr:hypothetical protein [Portunus trituberculatus]